MRKISIDEEESADDSDIARRTLSEPLGTTDIAINYYRLAPGEGLPGGLHTHVDQEEVFVVVDGEATFQTYPPLRDGPREGDELTVWGGEAIRFAPGEFQSGRNGSDEELVVLAMGAPRDNEDVRVPLNCRDCGHGELRFEVTDDGPLFVCPGCGAEYIPQPCSECGDDDMRVTLGDEDGTIVVCHDCGAEFDTAPTTRLSDGTE